MPTEAELARQEGRDYEPADVLLERILGERRRKWEEARWAELVERAKKKAAQAARKAAGLLSNLRDLEDADWQDVEEDAYAPYLPKNDKWKAKYEEPAPPDIQGLPELPEGWVWVTLEQLAWRCNYGTSQKCTYEGGGPIVLRIPNIVQGNVVLEDIKRATDAGMLSSADACERGDMLIIRTNGSVDLIGRSALVTQTEPEGLYFASYLIRYTVLMAQEWVSAIWDSAFIREQLQTTAASSAGQYNLSLGKLNSVVLPLPPLAEQERAVSEFQRQQSTVTQIQQMILASVTRAHRLRQSILKRAFEGRLVPQDRDAQAPTPLVDGAAALQERLPGI